MLRTTIRLDTTQLKNTARVSHFFDFSQLFQKQRDPPRCVVVCIKDRQTEATFATEKGALNVVVGKPKDKDE